MPIVMQEVLVSSWQTGAGDQSGSGPIHVESFSWGVSQSGAHASQFDGRLLTARDLTADQDSAGKATFKEFTITKKTDTAAFGDDTIDWLMGGADADNRGGTAATAGEFPYIISFQDTASDSAHAGGVNAVLCDGSVRFAEMGDVAPVVQLEYMLIG